VSPAGHALDRRLHELRRSQAAAMARLRVLEADGTYALLAAGTLSGTTAARSEPVLARMAELRQGLGQLDDLLDQISALRDTNQVNHQRAIDLVARLNGPSIVVAAQPDPRAPVTLTSSLTTRTLTPQDFLLALDEACEPLRQVIAEVASAWGELGARLERAATQADRLAAELPALPSFAAVRSALAALPGRITDDPLGAADELAEVESALTAVATTGIEMARLGVQLASAANRLVELESALVEGDEALRRSRAEVHDPQGLLDPLDPEVVTGERGLRPWLQRLERRVAEGEVTPAAKGLERWHALAQQTLAAARQVVAANAGPSRRRQELQGLLRAAQAKADAAGRAGDPGLAKLAGDAHRALTVPCDLGVAQARVDAYLEDLRRQPPPSAPRAPGDRPDVVVARSA
jgi:hypothetical protein